jgi:hypothetical protein
MPHFNYQARQLYAYPLFHIALAHSLVNRIALEVRGLGRDITYDGSLGFLASSNQRTIVKVIVYDGTEVAQGLYVLIRWSTDRDTRDEAEHRIWEGDAPELFPELFEQMDTPQNSIGIMPHAAVRFGYFRVPDDASAHLLSRIARCAFVCIANYLGILPSERQGGFSG